MKEFYFGNEIFFPSKSRMWAAQRVKKKMHQPPATLTTRPRQGAHYLNFELERGGENKKDFSFFLSRMTNKADVSFSRTDSNSGVEAQKKIL